MNTATQQRLDELVGWLVDTAKSTEAFVLEQAPDVARQMIAWGFWEAVVYAIAHLLGIVVAALVMRKCIGCLRDMFKRNELDGMEVLPGMGAMAAGVVCVACATALFDHIRTAVYVTVAPKVYLIEEAAKLLR